MKIIDTVQPFVEGYIPTIEYLNEFYLQFKENYEEYFKYHCRNVEEKKHLALDKYPRKLADLLPMRDLFIRFIPKIAMMYEKMYGIQFTKDVHLLVGLFGSNAYVYRQYNPEIAFCLEKLPNHPTYIQIIIAHEFGHATHQLFCEKQKISWEKVDWQSPYVWLLQEGIATYLSTKIVDARLDEYFAYEEDLEWLQFASKNEAEIAERFLQDLDKTDEVMIFHEWFSINGGENFGFARLAYYLAYQLVKHLFDHMSEDEVFMLWEHPEFENMMKQQLQELVSK